MTESEQAFAKLASGLVGLKLSYLWRGYGSAVFLEFGKLSAVQNRDGSDGHPEGEVSLGVEWSWRVESDAAIVCGSWSDEELWEPAFDRLRAANIVSLSMFGHLPEINLLTDRGVRFVSFSTTDGQPQWHVVDRRGHADEWFTVKDGALHVGDGRDPRY